MVFINIKNIISINIMIFDIININFAISINIIIFNI